MLSLRPEENERLKELLTNLNNESKAKIVLLIDKSGQLISRSDSPAFSSDDVTFASLTAGNVAASEALSKLLGDKNLSHMFTETEEEGIYMILIADKYILVSIFDKKVSNLGIVRVKIKKYYSELERILREIEKRAEEESSIPTEIDVEDIDLDTLFE
ncbi:putative regulator of Ras-like GTPase activity (Roadblock/LC7/MglB family) [Thermovibrio guaymasensis]|uniref:Putative regulator of Ras-like GTPase activity (Roadblock/LC7/MglB family) n=1 Tax=Thermovibrio guaymasensis TaxID=240167 RepID=A0A420W6N4_9BACT|nr:roadblock/LC7 domain-containing protein [Thermovibrio guaymasensis]RKQ61736.1 putative regulator of Ras-like GTPase activity (Roadblock/LC7/MglB family) [Thermovibrio guaymasensis]